MNNLQILTDMLQAAVNNPVATSIFTQTNINANVPDPFAAALPRETGSSWSFDGSSLNMVVTPLLPVSLNSPYPKVGAVAPDVWRGETDKYAGEIPIDEPMLRGVTDALLRAADRDIGIKSVEDFISKLLGALRDGADLTERIARAEAIMTGRYRGKAGLFGTKGVKLIGDVDYGVFRTVAGTAYDKPGSTFWDDLSTAERKMTASTQKAFISENTYVKIKANPANGVIEDRRTNNADGTYTVVISRLAMKADGTFDTLSPLRDAEFVGRELTVIKTQTFQAPGADGKLVKLSYGTDGTIALLGSGKLGTLYVAPTVEGTLRGVPRDRFAWIEQIRPYEVSARAVENFVPVIEDYRNVSIIETGMTF